MFAFHSPWCEHLWSDDIGIPKDSTFIAFTSSEFYSLYYVFVSQYQAITLSDNIPIISREQGLKIHLIVIAMSSEQLIPMYLYTEHHIRVD